MIRTFLICLFAVPLQAGFLSSAGLVALVEHDTDATPEEGFADRKMKESLKFTIDEQINAVNLGNIKFAYDAFMSAAFKKATNLEVFSQFIQNYQPYWSQATFDWSKVPIHEGNVASVKGSMSKGGVVYPLQYFLIQEDNGWKVLGIEIKPVPN